MIPPFALAAMLLTVTGITNRSLRALMTGLLQAWEVSQANVSRVEHEQDLYLSTLSAYVAALGGRLELTAVFPDGSVPLKLPGDKRVA